MLARGFVCILLAVLSPAPLFPVVSLSSRVRLSLVCTLHAGSVKQLVLSWVKF